MPNDQSNQDVRKCNVCKRLEKGSHLEHRRFWGD